MCAHHVKFVARTVLVRNNDVEVAYRALDRFDEVTVYNQRFTVNSSHCQFAPVTNSPQ